MSEGRGTANNTGGRGAWRTPVVAAGVLVVLTAVVAAPGLVDWYREWRQADVYSSMLGGVPVRVPRPAKTVKMEDHPRAVPAMARLKVHLAFMRVDRARRTAVCYAFTELEEFTDMDFDAEAFGDWKEDAKETMQYADIDELEQNFKDLMRGRNRAARVEIDSFSFIEDTDAALVGATVLRLTGLGEPLQIIILESFGVVQGKLYRLAVMSFAASEQTVGDLATLERNWRNAMLELNRE